MFNPVLWTLDNEVDPGTFERLCSDLMYRNGYKSIIPFGRTRDGGRDAEIRLYRGNDATEGRVFFQYSLEDRWESKLFRELEKVKQYNQKISNFVFITSQNVSGQKIDLLEQKVEDQYGWKLVIFEREWLRLQLEEGSRDLAKKYLGIPDELIKYGFKDAVKPKIPNTQRKKLAWKLFIEEKYEEAIPKLKELLSDQSNVGYLLNAIAWSYYNLFNYKEALKSIEISLSEQSNLRESLTIKACILAEDGIENGSRAKLILAKDIFINLVSRSDKTWVDFYNLANVLKELGDFHTARNNYIEALKYDNSLPEVWTNMGICLHHLGEHNEELECFDKALIIQPNHPQALISRGMTLGKIFNEYEEALETINFALERDPQIGYEFPYIWYWEAKFLVEINDYETALHSVEEGLRFNPDNKFFLDIKSELLSYMWRSDKNFIEKAKKFFIFRTEIDTTDFRPLAELSSIYKDCEQFDNAFFNSVEALNRIYNLDEIKVIEVISLGLSIDGLIKLIYHIKAYLSFRDTSPLEHHFTHFSAVDFRLEKNLVKLCWLSWGNVFTKVTDFIDEVFSEMPKTDKAFVLPSAKVFTRARLLIEESLSVIARLVTCDYSDVSQKVKIDLMGAMIVVLPEIALIELSRQVGYLLGIYNVEAKELDDMKYVDVDLGEWLMELSTAIAAVVNDELKFLPKD